VRGIVRTRCKARSKDSLATYCNGWRKGCGNIRRRLPLPLRPLRARDRDQHDAGAFGRSPVRVCLRPWRASRREAALQAVALASAPQGLAAPLRSLRPRGFRPLRGRWRADRAFTARDFPTGSDPKPDTPRPWAPFALGALRRCS